MTSTLETYRSSPNSKTQQAISVHQTTKQSIKDKIDLLLELNLSQAKFKTTAILPYPQMSTSQGIKVSSNAAKSDAV